MAQNVVINGIQYSNLPFMSAPKANGQGDAVFWDISESTIDNAGKLRNGVVGFGADGTRYNGNMTEKAAASFNPSSSDQTINANQYLAGAQTIKAVTTTNLNPSYIAEGVVVKVGCAADDDCVASVVGSLKTPTITQDPTTHGLHIA